MAEVRVRFAPSPTGYLHVGGARTALYNLLYARNQGGTFILRVEDTDLERSTEESLRMQLQDLQWLGLNWDEGVDPETLEDRGDYGPYRQSQRLEIYRKYAQQLLDSGHAYYDFRTQDELDAIKNQSPDEYSRIPRPEPLIPLADAQARVAQGEEATVRFKVEGEGDFSFKDLVRGDITLPHAMVGDFVLMRSNGMPVYNFCCAVDDALMKISHVFRAEEHLSNTLRQQMIFKALGFSLPEFGHLSLILGEDRQKLSKRHGATSCNQYRERGYLPEALCNFVALLGWSSPEEKEILSREELVAQFSLDRLNPAGAVFDEEKLTWMNATHLRALADDELWRRLQPAFAHNKLILPEDADWIQNALATFKISMETLQDVDRFRPIDDQYFQLTPEGKDVLAWEKSLEVLKTWKNLVEDLPTETLSADDFANLQNSVKSQCGVKGKHLFMPIRVAVIGHPQGADLKALVPLLSKSSLVQRAESCLGA